MKRALWIIGIVLAVLIAIYFGVTYYANQRLDGLLEKANADGKVLTVGKRQLTYQLTAFDLQLDSVEILQTAGGQEVDGKIARVTVNGLQLFPLLFSGKVNISEVVIGQPDLGLRPTATPGDSSGTDSPPDLLIKDFRIDQGHLRRLSPEDELLTDVRGLTLRYPALQLPLAPAAAPKLELRVDSITVPKVPGADWTFNDLELTDGGFSLTTARLAPHQTARQQLTTQEYKDDWLAVRLDSVRIPDFPLDSLLAGHRAMIPAVTIADLNLSVLENPALVPSPEQKYKAFPLETFKQIERAVLLRELVAKRTNIRYGVLKEGSDAPDLTFDNGTITIRNWSSTPSQDTATVRLECQFEKSSPMAVTFSFPPGGKGRDFTAVGELSEYDLTESNPLLEVAADAHIKSGYINRMDHRFTVTDGKAEGELTLRYENLDAKLTGSGAFFKNLLEDVVLRDRNPRPDGELEIGRVSHEHDESKSFFNLYWKALLSGMKSSAIGNAFTGEKLDSTER